MFENPTKRIDWEEDCRIVRLAPQDQQFLADYRLRIQADKVCLEYYPVGQAEEARKVWQDVAGEEGTFHIKPVYNHCDYQLRILAYQNGSLAAKSCWRLIRCGYVPGVVVNYIHPDDYTFDRSGRSPGSPSIVKLEGGVLLASHGIFWGNGGQNLSHVFRSDDGGISWRFVSEVSPCFWGKLFTHGGKL